MSAEAAMPEHRGRVVDAFTFFNELDVVELRFAELFDVVDQFVVVEATTTHAGDPKPLVFTEHLERFAPYREKITLHVVDDLPKADNRWFAEGQQRKAIAVALASLDPPVAEDDVVIVSDADEVPRASAIAALRSIGAAEVVALGMELAYYQLNLRARQRWTNARATRARVLQEFTPQEIRMMPSSRVIRDAGWHFSFLAPSDAVDQAVQAKARAFAHREYDRPELLDGARLRRLARARVFWITNRYQALEAVPVDSTFPTPVLTNPERWAPFVVPEGRSASLWHLQYLVTQGALQVVRIGRAAERRVTRGLRRAASRKIST